jgi:RES domain-containing protein
VTPLPALLGGGTELVAWRLDKKKHAATWDSGEGSFRKGGRWNSRGVRAVYCSLDPATAVLEVAVNASLKILDTVPYVLTAINITDAASVHIINPDSVPNSNWLRPGHISAGQQNFGDQLFNSHKFIVIPSTASTHSWNLIFVGSSATGAYSLRFQEPFALDPRLNPPSSD